MGKQRFEKIDRLKRVYISFVGRLTLTKSILSVFPLACDKLDQTCKIFIQDNIDSARKIHWKTYNSM